MPPVTANWSMKSNSRTSSRLNLHVASLSVPTDNSKTELGDTPNLGFTRLIVIGLASTTNSTAALTAFFAKSVASISIFLLPSVIFIVEVNNLLLLVVNLSFISPEFNLAEFRLISLSDVIFTVTSDLSIIDLSAGSMARFGLLLSTTMICDNGGSIRMLSLFLAFNSNVYSPFCSGLGTTKIKLLLGCVPGGNETAVCPVFLLTSLANVTVAGSKNCTSMAGFWLLV